MNPKLSIQDVSKRFASRQCDVVALENTSFDVAANDFITILGPSGAANLPFSRLLLVSKNRQAARFC